MNFRVVLQREVTTSSCIVSIGQWQLFVDHNAWVYVDSSPGLVPHHEGECPIPPFRRAFCYLQRDSEDLRSEGWGIRLVWFDILSSASHGPLLMLLLLQ